MAQKRKAADQERADGGGSGRPRTSQTVRVADLSRRYNGPLDPELKELLRAVTANPRSPDEEELAVHCIQWLNRETSRDIAEHKGISRLYHCIRYPDGRNQILQCAIRTGCLAAVRHMLDCGAHMDSDDDFESTSPLLVACNCNHFEIAQLLVARGASVARTEAPAFTFAETSTLVDVCKSTCELPFVQWLVESGASVDGLGNPQHTPLELAVKKSKLAVVKYLVSKGARMNPNGSSNSNAAFFAALHGELEILRYFVDNQLCGCNEDGTEVNLLIGAVQNGHIDIVRYLLRPKELYESSHVNTGLPVSFAAENLQISRCLIPHCTDVNVADEKGNKAVYFAVRAGALEIVEMLIDRGADLVGRVSSNDCTAVEAAALYGRLEILKFMQQRLGSGIESGRSLFMAAQMGHTDVVLFLLDSVLAQDFSIDIETTGGSTALMRAALNGRVEMLQIFVQRGADVNKASGDGKTALINAAGRGHLAAVRYLCERGANVEHADSDQRTSLLAALSSEYLEMMKYLLEERQANPNIATSEGLTCVSLANVKKRADCVRVLLAHGASVDGVKSQRATPACEAVLWGDEESLKPLVQRDADFNIMSDILDEHGREMEISPLIIVAGNCNLELMAYLCDNGADADLKTSLGESALSFAAARGQSEAVNYLIGQQRADFRASTTIGFSPAELADQFDHERLSKWLLCEDAEHSIAHPAEYEAHFKQLSRAESERASRRTPEQVEAYRSRMLSYDNLIYSPMSFQFTRRSSEH